jgi:hypothetical protein
MGRSVLAVVGNIRKSPRVCYSLDLFSKGCKGDLALYIKFSNGMK